MQTFLPYSDFRRSVTVLDNRRLCKQIVEAWQIYTGRVPQANHPACLMWADARPALARYIFKACEEYAARFGKDHSILAQLLEHPAPASGRHEFKAPAVMRLSHCVNLWRKGVAVPAMRHEVENLTSRLHIIVPILPEVFPDGYYWPVIPEGQKARADRENWREFWNRHEPVNGLRV